ncbi:MAG: leucine-rich repeat protein [Oscillospiraceae bacterium]|nr:leucine-rich repeat protein [Oscillospiraceae bacterium]MBQ7130840.1 leucine-rich repeat protein [Oscillospiraceae bacterium]
MEFLRRGLSLLLAAVMIVGMLPVHGHALEIAIEEEPAISREPTETQTEPETEPVPETAAPPASVPEQTLPPETTAPETTAPEQTLPAQTLPQQTEPETQTGTDSWINPIYRDSLTEEDLLPFRHGTAALSDTMNNSVAEAAADLRAQLTRRAVQVSTRVRLPESKDSMNLLYEVFTKALEHTGVGNEGDYLRFHYGGWSGESEQTVPSGGYYEITLSYTVTWYTTPEQEEWMDTAVAERLAEMDLDGKTEYEKIRTIYFWLCENVGYDWDNLDDETYKLKYTAYAALANGRAVCQGYATLMYRMMLEAGIDCRVITGDAGERHAWNIVELEEEYYNMDATWDRGATDWHRHFLCTQDNFSDHIRDSEYNTSSFHAAYPMAKVPYVVNVAASGTLSNGMRWTLNADTQELTVSGTGAMPDFPQWDPPWDPYRDGVKTITLSEGITAVGRRAFVFCKNCTQVNLPSTLRVIREYGFNNLRALTQITLPEGLTQLDFCAFSECAALKSITIPGSVRTFGSSIFSNCPSLESVTFAEGMTRIPDSMFSNASSLKEVNFPSTLVEIGDTAFIWCNGLQEVTIPASVTSLGDSAFGSCQGMQNIFVEEGNPIVKDIDGVLFSKDGKTLLTFPAGRRGTYTVPDGVTTIDGAFTRAKYITDVIIPDSVTVLGGYSFTWCDGLTNVTIGPNVVSTGEQCFGFCANLRTATFLGETTSVGNSCFSNCKQLTSVTLPARATSIGYSAFYECNRLTNINIPETVHSIGSGCFQDCDRLTKVVVPANVGLIDYCMFYECPQLTQLEILGNIGKIDRHAVSGCTQLRFLRLGGTLGTVHSNAFENTDNLTAIYLDHPSMASRITSVNSYNGMVNDARSIAVAWNAPAVSSYITNNYPYMQTVVYNQRMYKLYSDHSCSWQLADFSNGVGTRSCTICGARYQYHYGSHTYVATVTEPTCTERGYTLHTCTICGSCYQDSYVNALGHHYQNDYCTRCGEKDVLASGWCGWDLYWELNHSGRLRLEGSDYMEDYSAGNAPWYPYRDQITTVEFATWGYPTTIGDYAFYGCENLTTVTLPENLIYVGNSAFRDCSTLQDVNLGQGLTNIEDYAFYGCSSLTQIDIPETVSEIGPSAFENCSGLNVVILHSGLYQIGAGAFRNCTSLPSIAIPSGISRLDDEAFADCTGLETVFFEGQAPALGIDVFRNVTATIYYPAGDETWEEYAQSGGTVTWKPNCHGSHTEAADAAVPPTCTEPGLTEGSHCSVCGDILTAQEEIPALGHDWDAGVVTSEPTEEADGIRTYTCSRCRETRTEVIPALEHVHRYEDTVTAPTCTEQGYTTHTCRCGDSYTDTYVEPTGHSYGGWTVTTAPTCTETGEERRDCENCDHFETREASMIAHTEAIDPAVPPTCTETGLTEGSHCAVCQAVLTEQETVPATGHSYGDWVVTSAPTCTETGEEQRHCDHCSHFESRQLDIIDHREVEDAAVPPTCTEPGLTEGSHCADCQTVLTAQEVIPATGHSYGIWQVTAAPTCTQDGGERRDCENCGHSETRILEAFGHTEVTDAAVSPTCTEPGLTAGSHCSVCETVLVEQEEIPALGHSYGDWEMTVAPTCTETGEERRDCENCDHFETREIAATGHSYEAVVTAPTCTERGYTTHTCRCGDSYVDTYVDATGHSYGDWTVTTAPTCTETGTERRDCENCDHFETREVAATGHTEVTDAAVEATCAEPGLTEGSHCSVCNTVLVAQEIIPALGHEWDEGVVTREPTEEAEGERTYTCDRCGETRTEVIPTLDHVHNYEAVVTAPTCTERGYTTHTCRCGDSYVDSYVDATGHNYGDWTVSTAPTCTETGTERRDCENCDHFETREVAATGHTEVTDAAVPATCTGTGLTEGSHCSVCNTVLVAQEEIPALGHDWDEGVVTVEPTEETEGERTYTCERCGETRTEVIPTLDHVHSYEAVVTAPTCTERGYTTHTCRCGDSYVDSYVDATGHSFGDWTVTVTPTCTKTGTERRDCANCDHFETRVVAATGHSYEAVVTAPTCTERGYTTHICHCGDSYVDSYVDATGHNYGDWTVTTAPTCTETGTERRDCENCDHFETRVVAATGHSYEAVVTAPTCTERGYTTHTCHCGDSHVDTYVDALGHDYGDWIVVKEATLEEEGQERRDCSRCDDFQTRKIPTLQHQYTSAVTEPTCTEQGYTTHTCAVCGDSYVDSYVPALGHSFRIYTSNNDATCTEDGTKTANCERCDATDTIRDVGSAMGHSFGDWTVTSAPTCTETGTERRDCANCDHFETRVVAATGHSYEAVATAPTCTERGYTTHTCRCGDSYVDSYVDATGHSYGDWMVTTAPTCTETGTERRDCENCDHFETREVAATGHSYEAAVTAPTCTERGYTTHTCAVCGDVYVDSYVNALGHRAVTDAAAAPTCTETGLTEGSHCSVCETVLVAQSGIPALGHDWDEGMVTREPTEDTDGERTFTCSRCGETKTQIIPSLDHVHAYESVVTAPTCTERGYTTHTCRCGDSYVDTYVDALGHVEVYDAEIPATCTESGLTAGKHCSVCQETLEGREVIPALGHDYETGTDGIVCQVCGDEMYLRIRREYLALDLQKVNRVQLTAQISPEELADKIRWSVDDRNVLSVDRNGNVTARNVGTAYVIATVTDGDITLTDRCRIDVTEEMVIEGIQLSTNKLNAERYSADYATVDVLLKLPQNYSAQSVGTRNETPDLGVSIEAARFTDERIAELFSLGILDDRTLSLVPTEKGMNEAKGKYTGTITVTVAGTEYESEAITLTVKNTLPKLKSTISNFNSFYSGQSQEIQITGATVTNITASSLPNWLTLDGNNLILNGETVAKNASGKAVLQIETEEWNIPAAITLNVRNSYKAPGLKLSATNVNMSEDSVNSNGTQLKLIPNNKKDTLESLKVTGIAASNGYVVENFNITDGTFTLKATDSAVPGKIVISVSFEGTEGKLNLNLTVKNTAVTLKLSTTNVTLNPDIGDAAKIIVTATPADYRITNPTFRLEDNKKNDKLDSGELALNFANGTITVSATDKTPNGATYKLYISAGGSREVTATIKTVEKAPSMTLKATGSIDISFPENEVVVTPSFKNYSGAAIEDWEYSVAEMKGKNILNANAGEFFEVTKEGTTFHVRCVEPEQLTMGNTYQMTLKLTLPNGSICKNTVKLTIKQTALKLKLSASTVTLNKTIDDSAELTVTSTTKGYTLGTPVWQLMDKTGKNSAEGKLDIAYNNGKLTVSVNEETQFATTYKLLVKASEKAAATTLTVNIPAQNRSAITGTIKLVGGIDVIRDGSSVTVTPTYKNCGANAEREEHIEIYSSADKYTEPVTDLFEIVRNENGSFAITKSGEVDHTLKYQVKLVTDFGNGITVETKLTSLKVTMGTAKLTVNADSTTMFAKDKNCRVNFTVTSTDNALNKVKTVEIKDKKYQNILEVIPYGNGEFAIGYKEGKVDSSLIGKTITLNLNVSLEGNESTKVNGTVRLKLIFTK